MPIFNLMGSTGKSAPRWEHYSHEADMGVRGLGASKEEAFEQAAIALTAVITDPGVVMPTDEVLINCEAPDDELLLVDWLNALVFEMATRRMLFRRFCVRIDGNHLRAQAWGEKIDVERHQPAVEVKGATCTDLSVTHDASGLWSAQVVVDV